MGKLAIAMLLISLTVGALCCTILYIMIFRIESSLEGRAHALLAAEAIVASKVNVVMKDSGSSYSMNGGIDEIGNPQDDYLMFARHVLGLGQATSVMRIAVIGLVIQSCMAMCCSLVMIRRRRV